MLKSIVRLTEKPEKYSLCEFELEIDGFCGNPFDPEQISIEAQITNPNKKNMTVYGFYYEDFPVDGYKINGEKIKSCYRLRFSPEKSGIYTMDTNVYINRELIGSESAVFEVADNNKKGFLSVEPKRCQAFKFDNGELYFPVGQNLCWSEPIEGSGYDREDPDGVWEYYDSNITKMGANGANYVRIWLSASTTLPRTLYSNGKKPDDFSGKMDRLFVFDKTVEAMEKNDIYMSFALWSFNLFSRYFFPRWFECPFNIENGGYLSLPEQFFTNERAKRDAKIYLRYVNARWGYSTSILCYEFFNEVDASEADEKAAVEWHEEMCAYLRDIDVHRHLVTTSTANATSDIMRNKMFDIIYYHVYTHDFMKEFKDWQVSSFNEYGKPVIFGEFGATGINYQYDPAMLSFHQGNWAGAMMSGSGTGMNWWWSIVEKNDKYHEFRGISKFTKKIPWDNVDLQYIDEAAFEEPDTSIEVNGYKSSRMAYLWLNDKEYTFFKRAEKLPESGKIAALGVDDGTYSVVWYDFATRKLTEIKDAQVKNSELLIEVSDGKTDIFINMEPKVKKTNSGKMKLKGVEDREYHINWYNTINGAEISRDCQTAEDGILEFDMPEWSKDIALEVRVSE